MINPFAFGRSLTNQYGSLHCITPHLSDWPCPQLFLEEEREKELEELYESGIADAMNRVDAPIGSGAEGGPINGALEAETGAVMKQTMGTLMAGERIMEALDLADKEREIFKNYEAAVARLSENEALRMQPPPKHQVLVAYNLEPERYVLKVVEKVPSTALHDALLVFPFGKVVSLMDYLDFWVQKVCFCRSLQFRHQLTYRAGTSRSRRGSYSSF